jgi:hypothetical protein
VHIAIANLKRFLLGTYHGVSGEKLQRYLNEFFYRFNRRFWLLQIPGRFWLLQIPDRLLATALQFKPILRLAL